VSLYRFRRTHRLLKTDEFSSVFNFKLSRNNTTFQITARPNDLTHARLGLVVGRKVHKRAVCRNYMKRTVREWFRLHRETLPHLDFVVRPKVAFTRVERTAAITALSSTFAKLARCRTFLSS
jgi:ribonuclease P protein component